jgi:hydroxyacylglutathione hydrolase
VIIETLPVGLLQANCYLVGCEKTLAGAIIDPGGDPQVILAAVQRRHLSITHVLNTHGHFDHIDANARIVAATGARLAIHPLDRPLLAASGGAAVFGLRGQNSPAPNQELHDGDEIEVGRLRFQVLHTPGHTPGHVCFYEAAQGVLFDGDVLFRRGVGRADLPGGNWGQLLHSIR